MHAPWRCTVVSYASSSLTLCHPLVQLEEDLADDLKWSMMVKNVMFSGKSNFQEVDLIHTGPFGKVWYCLIERLGSLLIRPASQQRVVAVGT